MENMYINGNLAYEHGIRMGDNFLTVLRQPSEIKEHVTNESRLEDGERVIVKNVRRKSRTLTLTFVIYGDTTEEYEENRQWLYGELYKGMVDIKIEDISNEVYHLVYTGKSVNFAEDIAHTIGKLSVGFQEPNPSNRV